MPRIRRLETLLRDWQTAHYDSCDVIDVVYALMRLVKYDETKHRYICPDREAFLLDLSAAEKLLMGGVLTMRRLLESEMEMGRVEAKRLADEWSAKTEADRVEAEARLRAQMELPSSPAGYEWHGDDDNDGVL